MLPIVMSLAAEAQTSSRRFLMPMAFASSLGLFTLISTPPNLIINDALISGGFTELSFFSFLPVGLITLGLGILLLWPLSKLLISGKENEELSEQKSKSLNQIVSEYQIADNLYRVNIGKESPFIGKSLQELNITSKYNVSILEIRRIEGRKRFHKSVDMKVAGPSSTLQEDDLLYVFGHIKDIDVFVKENNLMMADIHESEDGKSTLSVSQTGGMKFSKIGVAEVVLMSDSKLINKQVKESNFRQLYNVNILGLRRKGDYILQNIKDVKLQPGDLLLVQGKWKDIEQLTFETSEWVVVGQPMENALKVPRDHKAPTAALIMILMILAMVFNIVPTVISAMIAAILMILSGCFRNVEAAYKSINWQSIFLFAGMFSLGVAMEKTGASI